MAHFTGLKALQNHPHRSGFDIGAKNVFSAKCGEILPVFWDLGLPGCTYDIDLQYFTRTRPVQTAAYTRIREYFDFYAVPIDLLWQSSSSLFERYFQQRGHLHFDAFKILKRSSPTSKTPLS